MRRLIAILLAAILVGMVMFQLIPAQADGPSSAGDRAAPAAPVSRPATDPLSLTTQQAVPAEGAGILGSARAVPDRVGNDETFTHATDADGNVLQEVGRRDQRAADGSVRLKPGTLRILDPRTGEAQEIRGADETHAGTQTTFAALDERFAVWIEDRSTQLALTDWTMYAADRETGEITRVAQVHAVDELGTKPSVPGHTIPSLSNGRVYWSEAQKNAEPGKPPLVHVFSERLGSDEPAKIVARDAILPAVTGDTLYYGTFDGERPDTGQYAVHRTSLKTGETELVERGAGDLQSLAAYGDTVAWSTAQGKVVVHRDGQKVAQVDAKGELPGWLSVGPDVVGFSDTGDGSGRNYLLDLKDRRLYDLGAAPGLAKVTVSGTAVAWALASDDEPPHQVWRIADLQRR